MLQSVYLFAVVMTGVASVSFAHDGKGRFRSSNTRWIGSAPIFMWFMGCINCPTQKTADL